MTNPDPEFSSKASRKPLIAQAQNIFRQLVTSDYFIKVTETFTTRIILILLSLLTGVIIARTLGPEGRGVYAMAVLLGTMGVQLTNLGLHSSNTFYVARDSNLLSKLLGNSLLVSFGFGSFASWLAWVLFKNFPNLAPVDEPLLFLGLLWIPFGLSYLLAQNLLLGMQNFKAYNKIEISAKIFNIILLGLIIGLDLVSPTTIFIAALLTMPFSFLLAFKHLAQHLKHKIEISATMFKKAIPYGLKAYTGSLIWFLLLRIDLFMINSMQGENFAGLYDVAFNMSEIFYILPGIIGMVLFPKLCAINDVKLKWELARKVGICLIVILVVISIISALVAEFFIVLLFGKAFIASTAIFILLMIGKILISINSIFSYFVASIHVPLSAIPFNMGLLILNVALNFIMIEKYGMQGAAITSIICFGLSVPFHMYYSFKYLRNPHTSIK